MDKITYLIDNKGFKRDLIRINWHFVTKHPIEYVRTLFDVSSIVWEISRPVDGYEWTLPFVHKIPDMFFQL